MEVAMRRALAHFVVAALAFGLMLNVASTQTPTSADRIEEDWELVIATPDLVAAGPQITTSMSPVGDLRSSPFVAFDLNYREYPDFVAGGMQIQVWNDKELLDTATHESARWSTAGETITWTQRMGLSAGSISYIVLNGQSTTWGRFGEGLGQLEVSFPTSLSSLSAYSPAVSVANSGASWESDRVTSMRLVAVRYYAGGRLLSTDTTPRPVINPR
jgi:hypothetical protein